MLKHWPLNVNSLMSPTSGSNSFVYLDVMPLGKCKFKIMIIFFACSFYHYMVAMNTLFVVNQDAFGLNS